MTARPTDEPAPEPLDAGQLAFVEAVLRTAISTAELADWWRDEKPALLARYGIETARHVHQAVLDHNRTLKERDR